MPGLVDALREATYVTVLTGAGISTDSGIPDFRGPQGLWTKDPEAERLSSLHHYMNDPELRVKAWQARLQHPSLKASPNDAHRALVELEKKGRLHTLVTQNIDGLHQKAGTSPELIIEIHGTLREVVCMSCGDRASMEKALDRVRQGEPDPACHSCSGILKSATISFGQNLVPEDLDAAQRAAMASDVFIAAGTSLTVFPVAYLPSVAHAKGARIAIFNAQSTPYDDIAEWVVRDPLGEALPAVATEL